MSEILLSLHGVSRRFCLTKNDELLALDNVSLQLSRGEILGLVGESGSGKSTLARCLMNLCAPTAGQIHYRGMELYAACNRTQKKLLQASRQMIFQDSSSSLNQRMKVEHIVTEGLCIHGMRPPRGSLREEAAHWLGAVGLERSYLERYPSSLSGGQRQRIAIARALCMQPELLVADEPVAALDASMQAQIINLFRRLRQERGVTLLFMAHDLAMVRYLCDRVGVLYHGKLVELAPCRELFSNARHGYTRALLSAIPIPDPRRERARAAMVYEPPARWRIGQFVECSPEHFVFSCADQCDE